MRDGDGFRVKEKPRMEPHYQRCKDGHMDLWYACEPGEGCPLCEVRARGWGKPDRLDQWAKK